MGLEAKCRLNFQGRASEGKALLETSDLIFRGGEKLTVRFDAIREAAVEGGDLVLTLAEGTARFSLGAEAPKWLDKIKNPKSVLDKLGVKPAHRVLTLHVDDADFLADLRARSKDVAIDAPRKDNDVVFVGVESREDLPRIATARGAIRADGALWTVRPKGKKEITEAEVRDAGKRAGLVDVKVVAFSATHTAEKFVVPVASRPPVSSR